MTPQQQAQQCKQVVDTLNRIFEIDPKALTALVDHRIECSEELALNTDAMVGTSGGVYFVGMLGIINALVAPEVIAAIYEDKKLTGFMVFNSPTAKGDS